MTDGKAQRRPSGTGLGSTVMRVLFGTSDADLDEEQSWSTASRGIEPAQLRRAYEAVCFANYRGFVFNTEVTVAWSRWGAGGATSG